MALNLDRPFSSRRHGAGMRIYAFLDEPGIYYDESGKRVSHAIAKECGFDVRRAIADRDKAARLADFQKSLNAEFSQREKEIGELMELAEGTGLDPRPMQGGGYSVYREDGDRIGRTSLSFEDAVNLLKGYADADEEQADDAPAATDGADAGGPAEGGKGAAKGSGAVSGKRGAAGAGKADAAPAGGSDGASDLI